jgi:hypothetical protein
MVNTILSREKNEKRVKTPLKIPLKHGIFILKAFLNLLLNAVASLKNALIIFLTG